MSRTCGLICVLALMAHAPAQSTTKFLGRQVTISVSAAPDGTHLLERHASVCLVDAVRQCYAAPDAYFRNPQVHRFDVQKNEPALLFSADTEGVSGSMTHFALLRPGIGASLDNFLSGVELSNQGQHVFWSEPSISDAKIFVTADFVWGPGEAHYDKHRYIISAYLYIYTSLLGQRDYYLEDRYMTARKSDYEKSDILGTEKDEIISRLRKLNP